MIQQEADLQVLSNPKSTRYIKELKCSPNIVAPHQLQQYYTILIRSINLNENTEQVFKALCKSLIIKENNLDYFISNNFFDSISFKEQPILNLIYILVSRSSKSITLKTVYLISTMIANFPREILHIIAIYTEKIKEDLKQLNISDTKNDNKNNVTLNPWTIFDIAIQNFNYFLDLLEDENTSYNIGVDYVALLGHIFEISIDNNMLAQEKLDNIWATCLSMLSSYDKNVVIASYSLLKFITDKISSRSNLDSAPLAVSTFPLDVIVTHLNQKKEFTKYAISFMLHFPPPNINDALLSSLISIANGESDDQNMNGTLLSDITKEKKSKNNSTKSKFILMQIANDENNCHFFFFNSKWMTMNGLPTFADMLTLFIICLSQKKYRDLLINEINKDENSTQNENQNDILDNITILFNNVLNNIPSDDVLHVICPIFKKIPLTEKVMNKLSESGFFAEFFNRSLENKNIVSVQLGLIMLHNLSKICYIKEFDMVLEKLVKHVENSQNISLMAATCCIELCKYNQCLESLKKLNFADVLSQNTENNEYQQLLKKFKKRSKSNGEK